MKAMVCNPETRTVYYSDLKGLEAMQEAVGGMLQLAFVRDLSFYNVLIYVNENGLLDRLTSWTLAGQPMHGPCIIFGAPDRFGNETPIRMKVEELEPYVEW